MLKFICECITKCFKLFFPSHIFLKFFIAGIIPTISDNIIPLFFIGNIPNESSLALAGQFTFITLILEVIQEGIGNSMFNFIGQNYKEHRELSLQGLKICLIILFIFGVLLTICIYFLSNQFVSFINTPPSLIISTQRFLWISSFSFPILLCNYALNNYMYITTHKLLIGLQCIQIICTFGLNYFCFGQQQTHSLHWGIDMYGYYKLIQPTINLITNLIFLHIIERISPWTFLYKIPLLDHLCINLKLLLHISWGNFGDSIVRNFFYFMVTLTFINHLGENEIGAWNLLNTIIWGLFLIPIYTISNYIKVKIGHCSLHNNLKSIIKNLAKECCICLTLWLILIIILGTLFWSTLTKYFSPTNLIIQQMSTTMFYQMGWIFIVFSFNNTMDALFFGIGKTKYIFYQSLFTNAIVYIIPWILYLCNVLQPTYWWVYSLYISGMLVDFSLTSYFCMYVWKNIPSYTEI